MWESTVLTLGKNNLISVKDWTYIYTSQSWINSGLYYIIYKQLHASL